MLNLWLDPEDVIQDDGNVCTKNDALPRPKRTVSDHFRPAAATAAAISDTKKTAEAPEAETIELSDDGGDGFDDVIAPPADVEDALVPEHDIQEGDGDDDEWPRYMNAFFDGDCKYRLAQQVVHLVFLLLNDVVPCRG